MAKITLRNYGKKPAFIMVGSGNKDKENKGTNSINYTKELLNMTKPEGFMFGLLMENRTVPDARLPYLKINETYIDNSKLTQTEKKYVAKAYKILREKDLIVRTRRQHYIINPRFVISNNDWEEDERLYIEAVEKLTKKS